MDSDTVTFSNDLIVHTILDENTESYDLYKYAYDDITLGEDFETVVPVKCIYPRHKNTSMSYTPTKQNVRFFERRYGELNVRMDQYLDNQFTKIVPSDKYPQNVPLNGDVFMRLTLVVDRDDLRLRVDSCIATSKPTPSDGNWRQLIKNGCAEKPAKMISQEADRDVKFSFKAFDFRQHASGLVYVHCEVFVCKPEEPDCSNKCQVRTRRAATGSSVQEGFHLVSSGPFLVSKTQGSLADWTSAPLLIAGAAAMVAFVAVVVAVLGWTRKNTLVTGSGI